jgi:hypothetical protein
LEFEMTTPTLIELRKLAEAATQGTWTVENVPRAGIQMRVPYQGSTRLTFVEVWRGLPEEWDKELWANAVYITKACPTKVLELLDALEAQAAEIEKLQLKLDATTEKRATVQWERDALRAELAALKAQPTEPAPSTAGEREPLTLEKIADLNCVSIDRLDYDVFELDQESVIDFARAVEAAHGIT